MVKEARGRRKTVKRPKRSAPTRRKRRKRPAAHDDEREMRDAAESLLASIMRTKQSLADETDLAERSRLRKCSPACIAGCAPTGRLLSQSRSGFPDAPDRC